MDGLRKDVQKPEIIDDAVMNLFQKSTMQMLSLIKNDTNLIQRFQEVESSNETSQDNDDDEKEIMPCLPDFYSIVLVYGCMIVRFIFLSFLVSTIMDWHNHSRISKVTLRMRIRPPQVVAIY
jgi:hypothetical protein